MWLSTGSNPREVVTIIFLFYICVYSKQNLYFVNKCRAKRKLYEKSCNSPPFHFNELQANYIEKEVNCKSVICNELQMYKKKTNKMQIFRF